MRLCMLCVHFFVLINKYKLDLKERNKQFQNKIYTYFSRILTLLLAIPNFLMARHMSY
jgi:hypothetical protein